MRNISLKLFQILASVQLRCHLKIFKFLALVAICAILVKVIMRYSSDVV